MVKNLVFGEDSRPFRRKLLALAEIDLDEGKAGNWLKKCTDSTTAGDVVQLAWDKTVYCWANPETDKHCFRDESSAYTSMIVVDGETVPCIAISSCFEKNDYVAELLDQPTTVLTEMDKMAQLFFFKKIKHEFCHVVVRFVSIYEKKHFKLKATPEKYTPWKQPSRKRVPAPGVGDHDEEEDTGGVILPLYFNTKLSSLDNPLCLYFGNKYLKLSDEQINSLLGLDYTREVKEEAHNTFFWSIKECRAVLEHKLEMSFYKGNSLPRTDIVPNSTSSSLSSRASSPSKRSRDGSSDDISGDYIASWRICTTPLRLPSSITFS